MLTVSGAGLEVLTVVLLKLQAYCCVVGQVIPSEGITALSNV